MFALATTKGCIVIRICEDKVIEVVEEYLTEQRVKSVIVQDYGRIACCLEGGVVLVDRSGKVVIKAIDMEDNDRMETVWMNEIPGVDRNLYALMRNEEGLCLVDFHFGRITKIIDSLYEATPIPKDSVILEWQGN